MAIEIILILILLAVLKLLFLWFNADIVKEEKGNSE
jgi:hypothetical protein